MNITEPAVQSFWHSFAVTCYKWNNMKKHLGTEDSNKTNPPVLPPKEGVKQDADDMVHQQPLTDPATHSEEDADDLVHLPKKQIDINNEDGLEDPDDLVHGYPEEEDEE